MKITLSHNEIPIKLNLHVSPGVQLVAGFEPRERRPVPLLDAVLELGGRRGGPESRIS